MPCAAMWLWSWATVPGVDGRWRDGGCQRSESAKRGRVGFVVLITWFAAVLLGLFMLAVWLIENDVTDRGVAPSRRTSSGSAIRPATRIPDLRACAGDGWEPGERAERDCALVLDQGPSRTVRERRRVGIRRVAESALSVHRGVLRSLLHPDRPVMNSAELA
jgi:hypothetical protein